MSSVEITWGPVDKDLDWDNINPDMLKRLMLFKDEEPADEEPASPDSDSDLTPVFELCIDYPCYVSPCMGGDLPSLTPGKTE